MDYLGNLYQRVSDYLWNGSDTIPQIVGIKEFGVKPFNFIRWDSATAEARFAKKQDIQPADMPEVEITMGNIRTSNVDSCCMQHDVGFTVTVASGSWKITNATKLYNQIMCSLSVLQHTSETCGWDIGKPQAVVDIVQIGDGRIDRDREIRKNQSGFTFAVSFTVRIYVQYNTE